MIDRKLIDEIRERNNIVEVIESYIPLKRVGSNYRAVCPFHQEKTPSFNVNETKQIFKCFGCGKAGNVFTFVQEYERIGFMEAVRKLAARVGVVLPENRARSEAPSETELLHRVYASALEHYRDNLKRFGNVARQYLEERKIGVETVERFEIGYALDSYGALKNHLIKAGFESSLLVKSGLFGTSGSGELHDFFRERIMFPIRNAVGKVIAFGGRVIRTEQPGGKYINSPTTDIYTKGNDLYGLFYSRYDITQKKQAVVVEGYLDLLRLQAHGINWSCASLGTALTSAQVRLIGRYTPNILMLYDGDNAGRKAAVRAASEVLKEGFSPKIVSLPDGEDPDSFLLHEGAEKLLGIFPAAKSLPEYLYADKSTGMSEREKIEFLKEIAGGIVDEISRQLFAKESAELFGIRQELLSNRPKPERVGGNRQKIGTIDPGEEESEILRYIIDHAEMYEKCCQFLAPEYFVSEMHKRLSGFIAEHREELASPSSMLGLMTDEPLRAFFADILMRDTVPTSPEEYLSVIELKKLRFELENVQTKIKREGFSNELYLEKTRIQHRIKSLSAPSYRKGMIIA